MPEMTSVTRPFRFGVLAESAQTPHQLLATARAAEDAGYATLLIRDHILEAPFGHQLGPLTALTAVACATTRLRIGTLVFANDFRPPVLLAKELATLDQLSGGRLEIGLGTGFLRGEYDAAGLAFDAPKMKVDRIEEAIQLYKRLLSGQPCTFEGEHYQLAAFDSFPAPIQRPHPPILIGAGGKRMLRLAGREANSVSLLSSSTADGVLTRSLEQRRPAAVAQQVAWVREGAGSRFSEVELSVVAAINVTDDRHAAARDYARQQGWSASEITPSEVLELPTVLFGTPAEIVQAMAARREQFGLSYFVVSDRQVAEFAPVVALAADAILPA